MFTLKYAFDHFRLKAAIEILFTKYLSPQTIRKESIAYAHTPHSFSGGQSKGRVLTCMKTRSLLIVALLLFTPAVSPPDGPSWFWEAVLAFPLLLLIFLLILGLYLFCKRCKSDAVDGTSLVKGTEVAPAGHGTIRSYSDMGAGQEDSNDYDLRHLMKYTYTERKHAGLDLEHDHEHANIRNYKDSGVRGIDNHQFDIKQLMSYK